MDQTNMNKVKPASKPKTRRKGKSLEKSKAKKGYFFVLPFILGFFLIYSAISS